MRNTFVRLMFAAAALALCTATVAPAQDLPDHRTYFTFSGPTSIPGVTLPAGKYLFRTVGSGNNVVQVLNANVTTSYAMFFVHRVDLAETPSASEVRFMETAPGMPQALKGWWYTGMRSGFEFVYPKEQARLLAKGIGQPVLTEEPSATAASAAAAPPPFETISPSGTTAPLAANEPAEPATGRELKGEPAPGSVAVAEATQARAELPRTASSTPLVALIGVLLVMTAVLVRGFRLNFE